MRVNLPSLGDFGCWYDKNELRCLLKLLILILFLVTIDVAAQEDKKQELTSLELAAGVAHQKEVKNSFKSKSSKFDGIPAH